jgi:hypothetical protein
MRYMIQSSFNTSSSVQLQFTSKIQVVSKVVKVELPKISLPVALLIIGY